MRIPYQIGFSRNATLCTCHLLNALDQKSSNSRTNPGKKILSRTTVFFLDHRSGLSWLSESLVSFSYSLCTELITWLQARLRKTKIMEGSRWLSKFLGRFFRLTARFWSHLLWVSTAVENSGAILMKIMHRLIQKTCILENDILKFPVLYVC